MDLMPTCVEVSGAKYPETRDGHDILPMEGRSLLTAIDGVSEKPRTLIFEHEHNAALIDGDWKLVGQKVVARDRIRTEGPWTLHRLPSDPCEQQDRFKAEPERAKRMIDQLQREARRTLILPAP
jgi:arylsulfatase